MEMLKKVDVEKKLRVGGRSNKLWVSEAIIWIAVSVSTKKRAIGKLIHFCHRD